MRSATIPATSQWSSIAAVRMISASVSTGTSSSSSPGCPVARIPPSASASSGIRDIAYRPPVETIDRSTSTPSTMTCSAVSGSVSRSPSTYSISWIWLLCDEIKSGTAMISVTPASSSLSTARLIVSFGTNSRNPSSTGYDRSTSSVAFRTGLHQLSLGLPCAMTRTPISPSAPSFS